MKVLGNMMMFVVSEIEKNYCKLDFTVVVLTTV